MSPYMRLEVSLRARGAGGFLSISQVFTTSTPRKSFLLNLFDWFFVPRVAAILGERGGNEEGVKWGMRRGRRMEKKKKGEG